MRDRVGAWWFKIWELRCWSVEWLEVVVVVIEVSSQREIPDFSATPPTYLTSPPLPHPPHPSHPPIHWPPVPIKLYHPHSSNHHFHFPELSLKNVMTSPSDCQLYFVTTHDHYPCQPSLILPSVHYFHSLVPLSAQSTSCHTP